MSAKEIEESIKRIKGIVDFYKLNDENNYDYSDDVLISMKNLLSYIEQLEKEYNRSLDKLRNLRVENEQLEKEIKQLQQENQHLKKQKDDVVEYLKYQLSNFDFEKDEDMKAKMLGSMVLIMLEDKGMLGEIDVED